MRTDGSRPNWKWEIWAMFGVLSEALRSNFEATQFLSP
ncbi:hypothetical protein LEP1GSC202_3651 [Leptospira yanagawae serovar Saopaulo str. Sao Paulo = ATCC 700523]|uniref:Uncharacterized protein n=1 Tax=Leptospira yanagawae serovar Saopaulo str. Sao Paulo = ATCC 700523 TaxID=1249483 RepID=A0A5E8H8A3_9LEPT|nr:hypothetical protein LEP1GSC202_3651 [Leptospira yanagawae serovar Saopaulo str. Sao Paulo = ATCC 700523]